MGTSKPSSKKKDPLAICAQCISDKCAMIATNTSSISQDTWLAAATDRPENFIGLHFMNPGAGDAAGGSGPRHRHQRHHTF